jgi:hypothetical protein
MKHYTITTDAMQDEIDATGIDAAVRDFFDGDFGIVDLKTLKEKFPKYVADGAFVRIEEDGEEILSMGQSF